MSKKHLFVFGLFVGISSQSIAGSISQLRCESLFRSMTSADWLNAVQERYLVTNDGAEDFKTDLTQTIGGSKTQQALVSEILAPTLRSLQFMRSVNNFSGYKGKPLFPLNSDGQSVETILPDSRPNQDSDPVLRRTILELEKRKSAVHQTPEVERLRENYEKAKREYDRQMSVPGASVNANLLYKPVLESLALYDGKVSTLQSDSQGAFIEASRNFSTLAGGSLSRRMIEGEMEIGVDNPIYQNQRQPIISTNIDYEPYVYNLIVKLKQKYKDSPVNFETVFDELVHHPKKFFAVLALENHILDESTGTQNLKEIVSHSVQNLDPVEYEILVSMAQFYNASVIQKNRQYVSTVARAQLSGKVLSYIQHQFAPGRQKDFADLSYNGQGQFQMSRTGLALLIENQAWRVPAN